MWHKQSSAQGNQALAGEIDQMTRYLVKMIDNNNWMTAVVVVAKSAAEAEAAALAGEPRYIKARAFVHKFQ